MKNKIVIPIIVVLLLSAVIVAAVGINSKEVAGGDRDEHGCLIAAGYSWNESEMECVREWEQGEERYQIDDFQGCSDAGYSVMESEPRQCRTGSGRIFVEITPAGYFIEQMHERGVEGLGGMIPVEGFDPGLYMGAFTGLQESDFDGVDAIGGIWDYENGELVFVQGNDEITSADGTLTELGLSQLLNNLETRFGIEARTVAEVEQIIDLIVGENNDGTILMQNLQTGEYACFGCNYEMCIDPAPIMRMVPEDETFYCNKEFELVGQKDNKLRFCPDELIRNEMPGTSGSEEYFIVNGERMELTQFDLTWVEKCGLEKNVVV